LADFYALRKDVETTAERVEEIRISAGLERLEADRALLDKKAAASSLWDDPSKAPETLLALTDVKDKIKLLTEFKSQVWIHIPSAYLKFYTIHVVPMIKNSFWALNICV